ncbi:hypothetical protein [Lichenifustis flavocetrariae]|uniref:Cysteine rich repeat-containing protein n=1 Tax=Lichenifustis flavocetrariae TaxID=2949735 RepID=A0AA41Z4X6_9HYPH|nr:hypothetical protein [Lichenifustis flavocetrariae]MCW6510538.1 hypothetical protein [Lichenifustis flavocetrariae]
MQKRMAGVCGMLVLAAAVTGLGSGTFAQDRGSMEDQMACTPDVYRLCGSYVPDEDAIVQCLKRNLQSLSPACHKVFSQPDTSARKGGDEDDN